MPSLQERFLKITRTRIVPVVTYPDEPQDLEKSYFGEAKLDEAHLKEPDLPEQDLEDPTGQPTMEEPLGTETIEPVSVNILFDFFHVITSTCAYSSMDLDKILPMVRSWITVWKFFSYAEIKADSRLRPTLHAQLIVLTSNINHSKDLNV